MKFLAVLLLSIPALSIVSGAFAQPLLDVATAYPVTGADIRKGMIVSMSDDVVSLSSQEYDLNMFGVITESPAITVGKKNDGLTYPISSNGSIDVLISTTNGPIEKGDFITTSATPGIGMKATKPGRVIGVALENGISPQAEFDLVLTAVNPDYATAEDIYRVGDLEGDLSDYVESPFGSTDEEPKLLSAVKYISSGIIVVVAFAGGIFYYVQISKKEVEALGRNPLAQRIIQKNMVFHAIVVGLICIGGLIMAYSVLQL